MEIIWSDDAKLDYDKNIEYLIEEWSEKSASSFIEDVESILDLLKIDPELYPFCDYKSIRRAVVRKQIILFLSSQKIIDISCSFLENSQRSPIIETIKSPRAPLVLI